MPRKKKSAPPLLVAAAAVARAERSGVPTEIAATRTVLNEAKVSAFAKTALDTYPPHLTAATRSRLELLTVPGVEEWLAAQAAVKPLTAAQMSAVIRLLAGVA